ncbi:MAG: hypothetical protein A2Y41_08865 [Spirochaetes bacterium GWB1_36_13]|nr:MAG: hypothetical protein A2Y41_08865 [Spirochaetes bacterium GWB1_36_13]
MEKFSFLNKKFFTVVFLLLAGFGVFSFFDKGITLEETARSMTVDKIASVYYRFEYKNFFHRLFQNQKLDYQIQFLEGADLVRETRTEDGFYLSSMGKSGKIVFEVTLSEEVFRKELSIVESDEDYDRDGFPDSLKLVSQSDRENFTDWFISIAESQYYQKTKSWEKIHHDCAGLIVFAYKEALKEHTAEWFKKFPYLIQANIPDVAQYHYPFVPGLGTKIFRTRNGEFQKEDLENGSFAETADVKNLLNFNLVLVGKEKEFFQKGDILFFIRTENPKSPYHSMIYTGESGWLIYHTGPVDEKDSGEVRKVKFDTLVKHPDSVWHPVRDNPHFMGAYRWKILQ